MAFIATMMRIDRAIRQYYPPGARWTLLTEGEVYKDMMDVPDTEIKDYIDGVKRMVSILDAECLFEFISLKSILESFPEFQERVKECRTRISKSFDFTSQVGREILWTFFTSQDVRDIPPEILRKIYTTKDEDHILMTEEEDIRQRLQEHACAMAVDYLALNEAKHLVGKNGAIQDMFATHLYVSITKKKGRYAFHPVNKKTRILPHHGIPVLRGDGGRINIQWLDNLRRRDCPDYFLPIYLEDDKENLPFYYQEVRMGAQ